MCIRPEYTEMYVGKDSATDHVHGITKPRQYSQAIREWKIVPPVTDPASWYVYPGANVLAIVSERVAGIAIAGSHLRCKTYKKIRIHLRKS